MGRQPQGAMKAVAAAVALMLTCCLMACGNSAMTVWEPHDEEIIRSGVQHELDALRQAEADEVTSHLLQRLSYSIGDITVKGDSATVHVTITAPALAQAAEDAASSIQVGDEAQDVSALYGSDDTSAWQRINERMAEILLQHVDASEQTVTSEVVLSLSKDRNQWSVDGASLNALRDAIVAGFTRSEGTAP